MLDTIIYVGGQFTNMGGQSRLGVAAINANTALATSWKYDVINGYVYAVLPENNSVFIGGGFNSGAALRSNIAALDVNTGRVTSWDPGANSTVYTLSLKDDLIYAGGAFTSIGGQGRNYLAAIDITTGAATSWDPAPDLRVYALSLQDSLLYVGGGFGNIAGQPRNALACLDVNNGTITPWAPSANAAVRTIATVRGALVYAGGDFTVIGGQVRNRIAAIDISTGSATSFNPNANNIVNTLFIKDTLVYAGGAFDSIGGQARNYLAAIGASTGMANSWDPSANNTVKTITVKDNIIWAGGFFTSIGGSNRTYLAGIDANTGVAAPWNAYIEGGWSVLSLNGHFTCTDHTLYVGGYFSNVDSSADIHSNFAGFSQSYTPPDITIESTIALPVMCDELGTIIVRAIGGAGNELEYSINMGSTFPNTSGVFNGLATGTYQIVVRDIIGCKEVTGSTIVIEGAAPLSIQMGSSPDVGGSGIGKAWVTVSGGAPPYTYQWNDPGSQTTDTAYNLFVGLYEVVVTNGGCTISEYVTVGNVSGIAGRSLTENIFLYPNPGDGYFWLSYTRAVGKDVKVAVSDLTGRRVWERQGDNSLPQYKDF